MTYNGTSNTGLERRLDLLLREQLEIDMLVEERVAFDLFCAFDAETTSRVAVQQRSEDALRFWLEFLPENKRVVQDLLIHLVRLLCVVQSINTMWI
jgi:hypothetical protein